MIESLHSTEPLIRLACFVGFFVVIAIWELCSPRRNLTLSRWRRWPNNLGIAIFNTVTIRLLIPLGAVGAAFSAQAQGWGLLNQLGLSTWLNITISVVLFDIAIYGQHRLFHYVPWLWRVHRVHHADVDFDFTTGVRFHPIEILLSMGIKLVVTFALGAPAIAVLVFEVLLSATSLFNHGNIALPQNFERSLRYFIVTPDMHRVHHSIVVEETNSNFGFNLSWWDRLFGTYRADPLAGHGDMTIGILEFRGQRDCRIDKLLMLPFREK